MLFLFAISLAEGAPAKLFPFIGLKTVPSAAPSRGIFGGRKICAMISATTERSRRGGRSMEAVR